MYAWRLLLIYNTSLIDEAKKIAVTGYLHAMKYHRTINLIDYILRTAHSKDLLQRNENVPYTYTGQQLVATLRKVESSKAKSTADDGGTDDYYNQ